MTQAKEQKNGKNELKPFQSFKLDLERMGPQFRAVLPEHISLDRFKRTVLTAVTNSPGILEADRRTLFSSALKAASDGLLPDGREAAFVKYGRGESATVSYLPMIGGLLKKVRQSGELRSITANLIHESDEFEYYIDENGEHLRHRPDLLSDDRGPITGAYAQALTKDGGVYIEVMSRRDLDAVRNVSRAKDSGPWKTWYGEMARKSVMRRLIKRLPTNTELATILSRDEEHYDLKTPPAQEQKNISGPENLKKLMDKVVTE